MQFDFAKTMIELSDAELVKIVTIERNNYQPAAIAAAEAELDKRNLNTEQLNVAKKINVEELRIKTIKENTPLDTHWKILTFIFPGILQIILSGTFKGDGYDRKANELVKWTLYGLAFYIILGFVISKI